jgi:hypothetical protein
LFVIRLENIHAEFEASLAHAMPVLAALVEAERFKFEASVRE